MFTTSLLQQQYVCATIQSSTMIRAKAGPVTTWHRLETASKPAARSVTRAAQCQELQPFALERFFSRHEFSAPHLLCCSDVEPLTLAELLTYADADSLDRWMSLRLAYTEAQGLPALRRTIAAMYDEVSMNEVVCCAPEEGIYLAMRAILRPGDHVVVTFPAYESLFAIAEAIGCTVSRWEPTVNDQGVLDFQTSQLRKLVKQETKLIVTNFPHNPTGLTLSSQGWSAVVETCRSLNAWLFSDEMYRTMEHDSTKRLRSAVDTYAKAVSLSGVSKTIGLPGLRIGWIASHSRKLIERFCELKDYTTICSSAPSEVLALMGLRARDRLLSRSMGIVRPNLALLEDFFARWEGTLQWERPHGGSMAFPRLTTGEPIDAFCERLVKERGVLLLPSTVYDHVPSIEQGRFRIGYGRVDLPVCLEKLDEFLQSERATKRAGAAHSNVGITSSQLIDGVCDSG